VPHANERPATAAALCATASGRRVSDSNRIGLDYRREAAALPARPRAIIDFHAHVNGPRAAPILRDAMDAYGIGRIFSMTSSMADIEPLRSVLGDRIDFIAFPDFRDPDRRRAHGEGYADRVRAYHTLGARIVKFWAAPRGRDLAREAGDPTLFDLDSPARLRAMEVAGELDMRCMAHVADPDTWFATKYSDASLYGTKRSHFDTFERVLVRYPQLKWVAAHMGGSPEDLDFLDGLLSRHGNLWIDASATKWVVRELSRHPPERVRAFFARWHGRILFGSDNVTSDEHLTSGEKSHEMARKADSEEAAFDLYASRYWALRALFETDWHGESPIADPDLAMVDPVRHSPGDSPLLRGMALPSHALDMLYRDAAEAFMAG
jgi:hypothetical protein